jgi:Uri superfamily endonuclease
VKGVYVLVVSVGKDIRVSTGALGDTFFERGLYVYAGSAQNGLEKRVKRHLRKAKRKFWHVDYLLDSGAVKVTKAFCKEAGKSEECSIARRLSEKGVAVKNFGCSDCDCISHLFRVKGYSFLREFMHEMKL